MKNSNNTNPIYRVNAIRSQRAVEREHLEHPAIERWVGDYATYREAKEVYDATETGTEVEKELVNLETGEVIETTY